MKNGQLNMQEVKKIYAKIEGNGELEGFGTAEPAGEEDIFLTAQPRMMDMQW